MSAFVRRIRDSLAQHSPRAPTTNFSTPLTQEPRPSSYDAHSSDAEGDWHSNDSETAPPPLPVIRDLGPPTLSRYPDPNVFWNSIMIAADEVDEDGQEIDLPGDGPHKAGRSQHTSRSQNSSNTSRRWSQVNGIAQEDGSHSSASDITAMRLNRHDIHDFRRLERNISYGEERGDDDLTVTYCAAPEHSPQVLGSLERRSSAVHIIPGTAITTAASERRQVRFEDLQNSTRQSHSEHHSADAPAQSALTWNICLNQILHRVAVDPHVKQIVKERVKKSSTTNGYGEGRQDYVSTREAGVVPNFSYPVTRSRFFDRTATPPTSPPGSPYATPHEPNTANNAKQVHLTSTITNHWLDFDFGFDPPTPTPTTSPSPSPPTPSSSSSSFTDRAPSPNGSAIVLNHMSSLLHEVLTPSELDLYNLILEDPLNPPSSLLQARLCLALYTIIYHLQDRISHMEEILLPYLAKALKDKTAAIERMEKELEGVEDRINQLVDAVNFASQTLDGCLNRENVVSDMLVGIRERRSGWPKWWRVAREGMGELKEGEIEVLVGLVEGNVKILGEERDELWLMAERYAHMYHPWHREEKGEEDQAGEIEFGVEEGSWRDV